jgi:hypothetical protein
MGGTQSSRAEGFKSNCVSESENDDENWWYECKLEAITKETREVHGTKPLGELKFSRERIVIDALHKRDNLPLGSCILNTFEITGKGLRGAGKEWLCSELQNLREKKCTHIGLVPVSGYNQSKLESYYAKLGFKPLNNSNLWYTAIDDFVKRCNSLTEGVSIQGGSIAQAKALIRSSDTARRGTGGGARAKPPSTRKKCVRRGCLVCPRNPKHRLCSKHKPRK